MRYAHGLFIGFIIPGIIFIGTAIINILGRPFDGTPTEPEFWNLYTLWIFISIAIIFIPILVAFVRFRSEFRQFFYFEAGGVFLFSPLWFLFASEISGTSIGTILADGVERALIFPGEGGTLTGVDIGPVFLIPLLVASAALGLFLLRPSFIEGIPSKPAAPKELEALKKKPTDELDEEMPDVAPPVADSHSVDELRNLLTELSVPNNVIENLLASGYATITDLISTSADKLAKDAGIDAKAAQELHLSIQKKVWFGGIE